MQSAGLGHKMKGGVLRQKNGPIEQEQILEEPDGTEIANRIVDAKVTLGAARLLKEERVSADDNATTVKLGEQGVEKHKATLGAQGTATSQAIGAGAEVKPITVTPPGS